MPDNPSAASSRGPRATAFAAIQALGLVAILAALVLIYGRLGEVLHVQREQLGKEISDGPLATYPNEGVRLAQVSVERIPDNETITLGETRPMMQGEWIHVSRYTERFESVDTGSGPKMVRKAIWIHIPSRTKLTLTYESARATEAQR